MKPNFKNIDIYAGFQPQNGMEWQKENGITADWKTPEHINVKPVYTCLIYTSPSPRDRTRSRMPSSA